MRIAALSDFHIGARTRGDAFGHEPREFALFLDSLLATHDRLVLLGDIFTADHAPRWGRRFARRRLRQAIARVPTLASRLHHPRVHYVHGNHDLVASDVLGAAERLILGPADCRVLLVHGHQYDPVARRARALANLGTWTTGRLRAGGLGPVAAWLEARDVELKDRRFRGVDGPYARAADTLCRTHRVRAVVMGHTHAADATQLPHGYSFNTGTCSEGRVEWVSIDTVQRIARVVRGDREICAELAGFDERDG